MMLLRPNTEVRDEFMAKYVQRLPGANACWLFRGETDVLRVRTGHEWVEMPVERFAFLAFFGHAEDDLPIHHACGNALCVRPEHLHSVEQFDIALPAPEYVTAHEAAEVLRTTVHAINAACRRGDLPGIFLSTRAGWRVQRTSLYRYGAA